MTSKGRNRSLAALAGLFVCLWLYVALPLDLRFSEASGAAIKHSAAHKRISSDISKLKVTAFIAVMTGFTTQTSTQYNYELRRKALRSTWFPSSKDEAQHLQEQGLAVRFVIGRSKSVEQEAAIGKEQLEYGNFLRLPIPEHYGGLPNKVLVLLHDVLRLYDFEYLFKVDDDVYLRMDRVIPAVEQWKQRTADYVGCMKQGAVFKDKNLRWYEPQHALLGEQYFTHCWGSAYVLSVKAVRAIVAVPKYHLRFFDNEDVTVGSWMLAFNVTHYDDRRLCETACSSSSLVVYDYPKCAGLCNPVEQLVDLHKSEACRESSTNTNEKITETRPIFWFQPVPVLN